MIRRRLPSLDAAPKVQSQIRPADASVDGTGENAATIPYPSGLHYADSPVQRRVDRNGISARENAAVHQLSDGKVDLHGLGASIQRVAADDPRLTSVGASSYAQGTQALISNERDRGHELWHLAQQAMGKVKADSVVSGRPLNTQEHLEREADVMGARISAVGAGLQDF